MITAIKDHFEKGNYDRALQLIAELPEDMSLEGQIIKSRIFERQGNFKEALALAENAVVKTKEINNNLLELEALNAQIYALWRLSEFKIGLRLILMGENLIEGFTLEENKKSQDSIATLYHVAGNIHFYKGDPDHGLKYFQKSLRLREILGNKQMISFSYNNIGIVYYSKGDLDKSLEYYQKALTIDKELGNNQDIAYSYNNIGGIYRSKGEFNQALNYFKNGLDLFKSINTKHDIATSYSAIGGIYHAKGNLDKALSFYQKSLIIRKQVEDKVGVAGAYSIIGRIHRAKGELNQAFKCFQTSLNIFKSIGSKGGIAQISIAIGGVHFDRGELDQAQQLYENSLDYARSIENPIWVASILFNLIRVILLREDDENQVKQLLDELEKINSTKENKPVNLEFRLAKALILKQSKRIVQKIQAQEIFTKIASEEILDYSYTVLAMQNLTELLLDELKTYGEPEVLEEAKNLIKNLYEIGQSQHSFTIIVDSLILQSKFALLEGKLTKATKILDQAILTAEEKGLDKLLEKAKHERKILNSQLSEWKNLVDTNASMYERVNQAQIYEYLKKAQQIISTSDYSGQF
jgi:tetratricopeptide (TPR) repeat protein